MLSEECSQVNRCFKFKCPVFQIFSYGETKNLYSLKFKRESEGTSLVAQWLRICLPMQGTRVQSLVREDPACCGATKSVCHNY